MNRVAILGDGSMGIALAETVARGDRPCILWCRTADAASEISNGRSHPKHFANRQLSQRLVATHVLEEALRGASLVIVAVPSGEFRHTCTILKQAVSQPPPTLSATKGIELAGLKRMSEVLTEELKTEAVGTISGPNITPDIMDGQLTAIVIASNHPDVVKLGAVALHRPRLKVYASDDLVGVEFAGVFKNTIAVAMGIASGLDWPSNARSFLLTRGLAEITALGIALGARDDTFYGLAGIGDLFLTSTSPHSLNYRLGIELGRDGALSEIVARMPEVPEGINSVRGCCAIAEKVGLAMPLANTTLNILEGRASAKTLEQALVSPDAYGVDADAFC
ncbi:NAD(P)-dependent glycerol-3-phosphate dehydrogenase [Mycobacterium fragae]|nr:NAD(P)H-dependent glycerol-3-phosphate dehydrogenase [Mycobacterium fragae]MCV7398925.1 NAD(P)-dependent glycerol-3-phosphate dehydrogenase [Mycobacterium fragae]